MKPPPYLQHTHSWHWCHRKRSLYNSGVTQSVWCQVGVRSLQCMVCTEAVMTQTLRQTLRQHNFLDNHTSRSFHRSFECCMLQTCCGVLRRLLLSIRPRTVRSSECRRSVPHCGLLDRHNRRHFHRIGLSSSSHRIVGCRHLLGSYDSRQWEPHQNRWRTLVEYRKLSAQ